MQDYEITKAAADDWNLIASYVISDKGETGLRALYKDLNKTMQKMARDHNSWRYTTLFNYTINIDHCHEYFILGVFRENKPLLVFAILHEQTEHMKRLSKKMDFFGDHRTVKEIIAERRNTRITQADHDALTADDDEG